MNPDSRSIGQPTYRVRFTMPYGLNVNLQVVYTENTEYHLQGRVCVGVRDRNSRTWIAHHQVIGHSFAGVLRRTRDSIETHDEPFMGGRLWFVIAGRDILTSPIVAMRQPTLDEIQHYYPSIESR